MNDLKVSTNRKSISILLIIAAVLIIYGPSISYEYNLDDNYILDNLPAVSEGLQGVFSVFSTRFDYVSYRPIPTFTVALEQYVTGTASPHMSHAVNVFLFGMSAWICFLFLLRLPVKNTLPKALLICLFFVSHPIHSNVVCSIKNRDALMSFLFGMLSLYVFTRYLEEEKKRYWRLAGVILLLLTAMLCKPDAVGFILAFPVLYRVFYPSKNRLTTVGWTVLMTAVITAVTLTLLNQIQRMAPILETNIGSAVLFTENPLVGPRSLGSVIDGMLASLFYYIKFHIWPGGYYFYFGYDMIPFGDILSPRNMIALAFLGAAGAATWFFWNRDKLLVFGILFFLATIAPALNVFSLISGIVAPRLAFIASFGFCITVVCLINQFVYRFSNTRENMTPSVYLVCVPVIILLSAAALHRNAAWKDMESLLKRDMPSLDRSFQAQRIAMAHYSKLARDEAHIPFREEYLKTALDHAGRAHELYDKHVYVEEGLGVIQYFLGDRDSAKVQLLKVVKEHEDAQMSYEILGDIHFYEGDYPMAEFYFKEHISRDPTYNASYYKLTNAMVSGGKVEECLAFNRDLIRQYPDDFIGYDNLGYTYLLSRDTLNAAPHFVEAMKRGLQDDAVMYLLRDYFIRNNMQSDWLHMIREIDPGQ